MTGRCLSPFSLVFALFLIGNPFTTPSLTGQARALVIEQFDAEINVVPSGRIHVREAHPIPLHGILEWGLPRYSRSLRDSPTIRLPPGSQRGFRLGRGRTAPRIRSEPGRRLQEGQNLGAWRQRRGPDGSYRILRRERPPLYRCGGQRFRGRPRRALLERYGGRVGDPDSGSDRPGSGASRGQWPGGSSLHGPHRLEHHQQRHCYPNRIRILFRDDGVSGPTGRHDHFLGMGPRCHRSPQLLRLDRALPTRQLDLPRAAHDPVPHVSPMERSGAGSVRFGGDASVRAAGRHDAS